MTANRAQALQTLDEIQGAVLVLVADSNDSLVRKYCLRLANEIEKARSVVSRGQDPEDFADGKPRGA